MSKAEEKGGSPNYEASLTEDGRYRLLVESVRDYAIYMLSVDGTVTNWNAGAHRFKGYTAEEIVGAHFSQFYTHEDRSRNLPARALEIAAREGKFEAEGWRVRKDGGRFWAHVVIDPIHDSSGELLGYAKITRDLTERREAERAFRNSEEQFRILVQGVTDYAIYMLDPTGKITNWNAGAQRIKGYRPDEAVGRHFSIFYVDTDREDQLPQHALDVAAQEGKFESEGWRVRKDGSKFWAHVVLDAIRNEAGELLGYAKITRDITERREAEQALEKTRVALFQSQKTEAIGQLTGGVAHDFNNLLSAIYGSLEILRKRLTDPSLIALADNALEGAKRGTALSRRMLTFARRSDLKAERIDIASLVHGMGDLFQRSVGPEVSLETRFPLRLPEIIADPNQVESALLNLVVNARDAVEGTIGQITVGAREESVNEANELAAGNYVRLYVTDNGIGMDDETLRRATEPFYTTKGVGKGTGLGLSMAQGLAEQSNGKLVILSKRGSGTTIEMWFPVAPPAAKNAGPPPVAQLTLVQSQEPLKILAVDDDSLVLMGTVAMLEDLGHTVYPASSGADAIEILQRTPEIELIVTDQAMPKMTGLALAKRVREVMPEIPIIIASGYAELPPEGREFTLLSKPFLQDKLEAALRSVSRKIT